MWFSLQSTPCLFSAWQTRELPYVPWRSLYAALDSSSNPNSPSRVRSEAVRAIHSSQRVTLAAPCACGSLVTPLSDPPSTRGDLPPKKCLVPLKCVGTYGCDATAKTIGSKRANAPLLLAQVDRFFPNAECKSCQIVEHASMPASSSTVGGAKASTATSPAVMPEHTTVPQQWPAYFRYGWRITSGRWTLKVTA